MQRIVSRRLVRLGCLLTALLAMAGVAPTQDVPKVGGSALRAVEDFARELVRGGHAAKAESVATLLRDLGADDKAAGRLRDRLAKEKRGVPDQKKDAALGAGARKVAATLAPDLPRQVSDAARRTLARVLLALDSELAAPNEALGRRLTDHGWLDDNGELRARARMDFAAAVLAARTLDFAIDSGPSDNPIITAQVQDHGGRASFGGLELHMFESPTLAATMLRQALRGTALVHWIRSGTLDFKVGPAPPAIMTAWRSRYLQAIQDCVKAQQLDEPAATAARTTTLFGDRRKNSVFLLGRDEMVAAWLLRQLAPPVTNALDEGALNIAAQLLTGCFEGVIQQDSKKQRIGQSDFYTGSDSNQDSYYAYAQTLGARHYLASLGDNGRVDVGRLLAVSPANVLGLPHVQGTAACRYLLDLGKSQAFFAAMEHSPPLPSNRAAFVREQLGTAAEPQAIADWLTPLQPGLAQQLDRGDVSAQVRREVDAARKLALGNVPHKLHATAAWNAQLDRGCSELLAERAGRPRTAAAAEAAVFAVVAEGDDPAAAVRAMLTSVAGRTALLDVGTLELGAAFANGALAVDAGSLRHPVMTDCLAIWPSQGATDIPTRYHKSLPAPEPGVDPAAIGYPLTIQLGLREDDPPRIGLRVAENGTEAWLPCYRFDPERPLPGSEPLLRTYGILPQQPLKPRTKYVFEVHIDKRTAARIVFTTGN